MNFPSLVLPEVVILLGNKLFTEPTMGQFTNTQKNFNNLALSMIHEVLGPIIVTCNKSEQPN